ncbi:MAG TPA: ATP synthase subunit I [Steroidobacteraceae bacterium]|nr:ATP synthase subunit I [Steroidobacteraceae bacterium]
MSAIDLPQARRLAFGVVLGQAIVSGIAALCAGALAGRVAALSALIGGGIATAGSLAMAGLVFGSAANGGAQRVVSAFYVGEAVKLAVVTVLFVVVLKAMTVAPLAMFVGFAVTFFVYWIALLAALPALSGARRGA